MSPESYEKIWKENFFLSGIHSLVYSDNGSHSFTFTPHPHIVFVQGWQIRPDNMVPTPLGRPKIRTFPGPFQDLGQIYKDLQLTYDS